MGKPPVIGLIYHIDENWIAGTYYVENLISALGSLPEKEQPLLKIYCANLEEYNALVARTHYRCCEPALIKPVTSFFGRLVNHFSYKILKDHWVTGGTDNNVDVIFPNPWSYYFKNVPVKLFWIPDFQERHYPGFFSAEQIAARNKSYREMVKANVPIVFSSQHARRDFAELFPGAGNKIFVMPFAVTLPAVEGIHPVELRRKFNLPEGYFICSNQFWAHKNHLVVLRALKLLKEEGQLTVVVFTGKPFDNRNLEYYDSLMAFAKENGLETRVRFLGFIPREEQVVLMKDALAIIQPSLFEGWSTVVEDAKAMNQNIIVSDIPVHREQLAEAESFFPPDDPRMLADKMKSMRQREASDPANHYSDQVKAFGRTFVDIIHSCIA